MGRKKNKNVTELKIICCMPTGFEYKKSRGCFVKKKFSLQWRSSGRRIFRLEFFGAEVEHRRENSLFSRFNEIIGGFDEKRA